MLIHKLRMVLDGTLSKTSWTFRPTTWETVVLYFEKNQITVKKFQFGIRRTGLSEYIESESKHIITMTPMLRIRQFWGGKHQPHSEVREKTYNANWIMNVFGPEKVGDTGYEGIKFYLRHYGYNEELYRAIIPWDKEIPMYEKYKRGWRHTDIRKVLATVRVPATKSMTRTVLNYIFDENNKELPNLESIEFIWRLTEDPNVFCEVWPQLHQRYEQLWDLGEYKKSFWAMMKKWRKGARILFARSLVKHGGRIDMKDWQDTLDMIKQAHEGLGVVSSRGTNIKKLHDNLSVEVRQVEIKNAKVPIDYEDELKRAHGSRFDSGGKTYTLTLPVNPLQITQWSEYLRNCMHTYIDRVVERSTTLIGYTNGSDKLVVGLEWAKEGKKQVGKVRQMSGVANSMLDPKLKMDILLHLHSEGLLEDINEAVGNRAGYYNHNRELQRLRRAGQMTLPGIMMVDIPEFDANLIDANIDF